MKIEIDPTLIIELIEIGKTNQSAVPICLSNKNTALQKILGDRDSWNEIANTFNEEELRYLITGLVLYSNIPNRETGGSVSPVIILYNAYANRFPKTEPELTSWIVDNRSNIYEPFGSTMYFARTFDDFKKQKHNHIECASANIERDNTRKEFEHNVKVELDAIKATQNLRNAVKRGDLHAVEALLIRGADPIKAVSGDESLVELAIKNNRDSIADFLKSKNIK